LIAERDQWIKYHDSVADECKRWRKDAQELSADLAAAIAAKEEAEAHAKRLEEYMLKGVAFRDELQARIRELECQKKALQQVNEKDEGQLCKAREQLKRACEWLVSSNYSTVELETAMHEINAMEASPCPHAKEAERLRALADRAEDVEGLTAAILSVAFDRENESWADTVARVVVGYLKEGK